MFSRLPLDRALFRFSLAPMLIAAPVDPRRDSAFVSMIAVDPKLFRPDIQFNVFPILHSAALNDATQVGG